MNSVLQISFVAFFIFSVVPISLFGIRIADLFLITSFSLPFLLRDIKIQLDRSLMLTMVLLFISIYVVYFLAANSSFDIAFVSSRQGEIYNDGMKWLIDDRGIDNFFGSGDSYRNSLIYIRYLLCIPAFIIGYIFFDRMKKAPYYLSNIIIVALLIHLFASLVNYNGSRITGLFGNTAELSSLALLSICFIVFNAESKKKLIIPSLALIFSVTLSAYMALFVLFIYYLVKKKSFVYIVVFISLLVSYFLVNDYFKTVVLGFINEYVYIGSLLNRFVVWGVISDVFKSDFSLYLSGLGTFPVFVDNLFWYLISGLGVGSLFILLFLIRQISVNKISSSIILVIFCQGILYPGLVMPYSINFVFFLIGCLYAFSMREKYAY
jgi:hypothetical protein